MTGDLKALPPLPETKAALLARIPPAWAALEALIQPISTARLSLPGPEGWAVKDHLVHIAVWEELISAHLSDGSDAALLGLEPGRYAAMSLQEINDHIHARERARPAAAVPERFRAAHWEVLRVLEGLDEARYRRPYWDDDPSGRTVMAKVSGDTFLHYDEHRAWIGALLMTQPDGREG